jgi:hypothetical protein
VEPTPITTLIELLPGTRIPPQGDTPTPAAVDTVGALLTAPSWAVTTTPTAAFAKEAEAADMFAVVDVALFVEVYCRVDAVALLDILHTDINAKINKSPVVVKMTKPLVITAGVVFALE